MANESQTEKNRKTSFFQILKLVCAKVEYAEEPIDKIYSSFQPFYEPYDRVKAAETAYQVFEILDWLAFTGVQITTLPSEFYLGSALSVLVEWWSWPMNIQQLKLHRKLTRKLVIAGADLHYRNKSQKTLLQSLLSSSSLQMIYDMILKWLQFLASCDIHVGKYALQENLFSGGKPFEVDIGRTVQAAGNGRHSIFSVSEYYTCMETRAAEFEFDDTGNPIPKISRWMDPESTAALVLKEFKFCQDLIIVPGDDCRRLREWIPIWERSPQDLRDIPVAALHMLAEMEWDFGRRWAWTSILPVDKDAIWILNHGFDGLPKEFLRSLNRMPEIPVSSYPEQIQRERDHSWKSIDATKIFIRTSVANDSELTKAFILSYTGFYRKVSFCNCDAFGKYLDLWPFHGSTHTLCQSGNKLDGFCLGSTDQRGFRQRWCETHKCRFNHARFERKQAKKISKRRKREGDKVVTFSMPGSWPS